LSDHIVDALTEILQDVDHVFEKTHGVDRKLRIVTKGLPTRPKTSARKRVVVNCLDWSPVSVPSHCYKLWLYAGETGVTSTPCAADRTFQCLTRANVVRPIFPP